MIPRLTVAAVLLVASVEVRSVEPIRSWDAGQRIYKAGSDGVTFPTMIQPGQPLSTNEARPAWISSSVELEVVVLPDGKAGEVLVVKWFDKVLGLDAEAVKVVRTWRFRPGTLGGEPVPTLVNIIMGFDIRGGRPSAIAPPRVQPRWARIESSSDDFLKDTYSVHTPGLVAPRMVKQSPPAYTSGAMRAKIQGAVRVDLVVLADGTIGSARIARSLDKASGLDEAALISARSCVFKPGLLDGQPVPVAVMIIMEFRLD